jgi:FKBP-type peptidyl-prolyl cis-trans isomerase
VHLKVCSARNLRNDRTIWPFAQVAVSSCKDKTATQKFAMSQKNVYWNHTFVFELAAGEPVRLEIKTKDTFLGPPLPIGTVTLALPARPGDVDDVWLPVMDGKNAPQGEVHCVIQFIPSGVAALGAAAGPQAGVPAGALPAPPGTPPGTPPGAPPALLAGDRRGSTPQQSSTQMQISYVQAQMAARDAAGQSPRGMQTDSSFDGHAAALTINELMDALENIKRILHSAGSEGGAVAGAQADPERLANLRAARADLDNVQQQIAETTLLSDEWRGKLIGLATAYGNDLTVLLAAEAWQDVNRRLTFRRSQKDKAAATPPPLSPLQRPAGSAAPSKSSTPPPPPLPPAALASPSHQLAATARRTPQPHEETTKPYSLESVELFDALLDKGFAVQVVARGKGVLAVAKDDLVTIDYTAYIWDSANGEAVSFESSKERGPLTFTVGDEEVPVGLSLALADQLEGAQFSACISPALAWGESGSDQVPPNTHVVYEGKITKVVRPTLPDPAVSEGLRRFGSNVDPDEAVRKSRASIRFPARQNRVSLSHEKSVQGLSMDELTRAFLSAGPGVATATDKNAASIPAPPPPNKNGIAPPVAPPRTPTPTNMALSSAAAAAAAAADELPSSPSMAGGAPPPLPPRSDYVRRPKDSSTPPPLAPRPVSSSKPDNSRRQGGPPATQDIEAFLAEGGFAPFSKAFHDIGVEHIQDLEHVQKSDLEAMGMRLIQIRKFAAHLNKQGLRNDLG